MAPKLYMTNGSPPCRTVFATANALGINLEMQKIDLEKGEQLTAGFVKLNPQRTVPVLDDNGSIICDSHAISIYLIDKYGKDDSLYPKDLYKRAVVNEKLFFDVGSLFACMNQIWGLFMGQKGAPISLGLVKEVEKHYDTLEKMLDGHRWATADHFTIADISLYTTVSSLKYSVEVNKAKYPNITTWLDRVKEMPYFEHDDQELLAYTNWLDSLL